MKRLSALYSFAALEFLRYFTLAWALERLLAVVPPQLLRFVAAPNLLFGVAFLFLALDPSRYEVYRPLVVVGKSVAVFAAVVTIPNLLGLDGQSLQADFMVLAGLALIAVWDIVSSVLLLLLKLPSKPAAVGTEVPGAVEVVEVD
jgi:hypothetical protein